MALEDILAVIRAESDTEIEGIRAAAEREAAALLERAHRQAQEEEERLSHSRDATARVEADRVVNRARLDRHRSIRAELETLYQQSLHAVAASLEALRGTARYEETLRRLIDEACGAVEAAISVRVDPADADLARQILAMTGRSNMDVTPDLNSRGGIEVIASDGCTVLNTFESRLDRAEVHLRQLFRDTIEGGARP